MSFNYKKLLFIIFYNFSLFLVLMVGIQNSTFKSKLKFLNNETVELPLSFTMGVGFIVGSIVGNLFSLNFKRNE